MYVAVVFFEVKRERVSSFSRALMHNARVSLDKEPACKTFDVSIDPTDGTCFLAYEVYDEEEGFKAHTETRHFKDFTNQVDGWLAHKRVLTYELISGPGQS